MFQRKYCRTVLQIHFWALMSLSSLVLLQTAYSQPDDKDSNHSWAETKKAGHGTITIFRTDSPPFISETNGKLRGIEYELMMGFKDFLKATQKIELEIIWKEKGSFFEVYCEIHNTHELNSFGTSGFSMTTERLREVNFSPIYLADIAVIISSKSIPIVKSVEEYTKVFSTLTAVTMKGSTLELDLLKLKSTGNISFPIQYVESGERILDEIQKSDDKFGFVDLSTYIDLFNTNPSAPLNRQNLFPKISEGYGIIYPLNSDWGVPMREYFNHKDFKKNLNKIISKYLDLDLYNFIESLNDPANSQISLLTKEKEIQSEHIKEEIRIRNLGVAMLALTMISLMIIILLFRRSHRLLKKIEQQGRNIELQNRELEEKNKKLEDFTFANAHKLRAPIATILGLIQLLDYGNECDNEKIIGGLKQSAFDLDRETRAIRSRLEEEGWLPREQN